MLSFSETRDELFPQSVLCLECTGTREAIVFLLHVLNRGFGGISRLVATLRPAPGCQHLDVAGVAEETHSQFHAILC